MWRDKLRAHTFRAFLRYYFKYERIEGFLLVRNTNVYRRKKLEKGRAVVSLLDCFVSHFLCGSKKQNQNRSPCGDNIGAMFGKTPAPGRSLPNRNLSLRRIPMKLRKISRERESEMSGCGSGCVGCVACGGG